MNRRLGNALYDAQRIDPNQSAAMKVLFRADNISITSRESLLEARRLYDEALRLQPDFLLAVLGRGYLSVAELDLDDPGIERDRLANEAFESSARALALDPDNAEAWTLRGVALGWQGRLDAAFEADARARQLDPSSRQISCVWLLVMNGQADEALAAVDRGISIDPLAIGNYQVQRCWANLQLGRYDEGIAACEKWLVADNLLQFLAHVLLTAAYAQSGNAAKAAAEKAIVLKRVPRIFDCAVQGFVEIGFACLSSADRGAHHCRPPQGRIPENSRLCGNHRCHRPLSPAVLPRSSSPTWLDTRG